MNTNLERKKKIPRAFVSTQEKCCVVLRQIKQVVCYGASLQKQILKDDKCHISNFISALYNHKVKPTLQITSLWSLPS